jgi:hypothetical protein
MQGSGTRDATINISFLPPRRTGAATPIHARTIIIRASRIRRMFKTRSAAPAYPTTREKQVEAARRNGANLDMVNLVNDRPDKNYYGQRPCPGRS